jgi:hypothetical protein
MSKIKVRRKYTSNHYVACLYPSQLPWLGTKVVVIRDLEGEYMHCITPSEFQKQYRSSDLGYKSFIKRAHELYPK